MTAPSGPDQATLDERPDLSPHASSGDTVRATALQRA